MTTVGARSTSTYLERIGMNGRPGLVEVHRAHATSVPFEDLGPHEPRPVSLDRADLASKLVDERRGGFCFEQNMLLALALRELGAELDLMLARVRLGAAPGVLRPRSHLLLRVRDGDRTWHADVGVGLGTLLEPIPFGPGEAHEQAGWRFRVVRDGPELVPQGVIEGVRVSLSDGGELELAESTPRATRRTPGEREEIPEILQERFGLGGFALGADGRLFRRS